MVDCVGSWHSHCQRVPGTHTINFARWPLIPSIFKAPSKCSKSSHGHVSSMISEQAWEHYHCMMTQVVPSCQPLTAAMPRNSSVAVQQVATPQVAQHIQGQALTPVTAHVVVTENKHVKAAGCAAAASERGAARKGEALQLCQPFTNKQQRHHHSPVYTERH
jgi:hypothetical protein